MCNTYLCNINSACSIAFASILRPIIDIEWLNTLNSLLWWLMLNYTKQPFNNFSNLPYPVRYLDYLLVHQSSLWHISYLMRTAFYMPCCSVHRRVALAVTTVWVVIEVTYRLPFSFTVRTTVLSTAQYCGVSCKVVIPTRLWWRRGLYA